MYVPKGTHKEEEEEEKHYEVKMKYVPKQRKETEDEFAPIKRIVGGGSSAEEDPDVKKMVARKTSINEQNVVGLNFHKYEEMKPSQEIRVWCPQLMSVEKDNEFNAIFQ